MIFDAILLLCGDILSEDFKPTGLSSTFILGDGFFMPEDCAIVCLFGYVAGGDLVGVLLTSSGNFQVVSKIMETSNITMALTKNKADKIWNTSLFSN